MSKTPVQTTAAATPIGPYSQGIRAGSLLFVSGQTPTDPKSGEVIRGDIVQEARRVLDSLKAILEAGGSSLDNVVKTTIFLADMDDFGTVNTIYGEYFASEPPARATVQVARLPRDVRVEIEAIALRG